MGRSLRAALLNFGMNALLRTRAHFYAHFWTLTTFLRLIRVRKRARTFKSPKMRTYVLHVRTDAPHVTSPPATGQGIFGKQNAFSENIFRIQNDTFPNSIGGFPNSPD